MRAVLLLLFVAGAASAQDALKAWKDATKKLEKREKEFWGEYQRRWVDAETAFWKPWQDARGQPDPNPTPVFDYSGFQRLYDEFVALQQLKGKEDAALAASGHAKAGATLLDELFDTIKRAEALDAAMLKGRPVQWDMFDQRPAIERHGLAFRHDALVAALASCGAPFLAEALEAAGKKDGKRHAERRVAVIDALGLCPGTEARALLEPIAAAPESSLRIAAAEALLRHGPEGRAALVPLLADPSPPVRRAQLHGIATLVAGDAEWVAPILEAWPGMEGVQRADLVRALHALTNQPFGHAPEKWKEWLEVYRAEIDGGRFEKDKIEVQEAEPGPLTGTISFYGIPTPGRGVVLVVDGSRRAWWPADNAVLKTQYRENWHRTRSSWEKTHASHQAVMLKEFDRMAAALPDDLRFGVVVLYGNFVADSASGKRLFKASSKADVSKARRALEKLAADGWCSALEGIFAAFRLGDLGPEEGVDFPEAGVDTVYLVHGGDPAGGRYVNAEAVVAAFGRLNRFRRVTVHAIRIAHDGEMAETVMRGIAERSFGTYLWCEKAP